MVLLEFLRVIWMKAQFYEESERLAEQGLPTEEGITPRVRARNWLNMDGHSLLYKVLEHLNLLHNALSHHSDLR